MRGDVDIWSLILVPTFVTALIFAVLLVGWLGKVRSIGSDNSVELRAAAMDAGLLLDAVYALPQDMNAEVPYMGYRGASWIFREGEVRAFVGEEKTAKVFWFSGDSRYVFRGGKSADGWSIVRSGNQLAVANSPSINWNVQACTKTSVSVPKMKLVVEPEVKDVGDVVGRLNAWGEGGGWFGLRESKDGVLRVLVNEDARSAELGCLVAQVFAREFADVPVVLVPQDGDFSYSNAKQALPKEGVALALAVPKSVSDQRRKFSDAVAEGVSGGVRA